MPSLSVLTGLPGVTNLLTGPTTVSAGVNSLSLVTTNLLGCSAVTPISVTGVALPSVAPISLSLCAGATVSLPSLFVTLVTLFKGGCCFFLLKLVITDSRKHNDHNGIGNI